MCRPPAFRAVWPLVVAAVLLAAGCRAAPVASAPGEAAPARQTATDEGETAGGASGDAAVRFHVVSNGWHSAIVVPRAALPPGAIPEAGDFPDAAYLSFGWGDAEYFPAPATTVGMTLRAALQPTPAVVHLAGLASHPRAVFPADEVVDLQATDRQFAALAAYLDASFDRDGAARARASAPGLHGFSLFYPATGEFHLLNTCNTWTARGLAAGGWPLRVSGTVTAEDLMVQVRALATQQESNGGAGR